MSSEDIPLPHSEGNDKYLRIKEAASIMSVSYLWLYTRVASGKGPPGVKRRGGAWLIPRDEFTNWSRQDHIP